MNESGLSYMLSHPGSLGVAIRDPAYLLLLAGAALVLWRSSSRLARAAAILRCGALVCLVLGVAGFNLTTSLPAERMTLVAAIDLSESIDAQGRDWALGFVNRVSSALAPGDELAVVTFGAEPRVVRPPGKPSGLHTLPAPRSSSATDVGRALETALALLPPDTTHRVLLLSDGNETRGSAVAQIARARQARAPIYAAVPPHAGGADVMVERLSVRPLVTGGSVFPIRAVLRNSHGNRGVRLRLLLDGEILGTEDLELGPGRNSFDIAFRVTEPGIHRLRVEVEASGDRIPGNNYRETMLSVTGPPRLLVLSTSHYSPVADALMRRGIEVEIARPAKLQGGAGTLLRYHAVIAENLAAADLPASLTTALETYVRDYGGGLLFLGGKHTYGDPGFKSTPLKRLLPITFEPRRSPPRERDPLALIVLIDRSNSMGYSTRSRTGGSIPQRDPRTSKLHYAKAAALAVIRQLKDSDHLGVIAFDSQSFPIGPLEPLKDNRARLEELIPLLVENGGTDFYDALDSARVQLSRSRVVRRHVILLTDGDTNRSPSDHYPLIAKLAEAGTSVTTIRIGEDVVNVGLLNDISARTGGRFYHIEDVEMLPQLLLLDTTAAMANRADEEDEIRPALDPSSALLRGVPAEIPLLRSYAFTKPKKGADLPLYVVGPKQIHPLLATWQYGLGRAAAFTADPKADADAWLAWPAYGKFWSQVVRWVMREQATGDYAVRARRTEGKSFLQVRVFDQDEATLQARVHLPDERYQDLSLLPVAPRLYEAELAPGLSGEHAVTVLRGGGSARERTHLVSIPTEEEEPQEEFEAPEANTELLSRLSEATGGKLNPSARELVAREPGTRETRYDLDFLLVPLSMFLFLGDVAIRRLWKRGQI